MARIIIEHVGLLFEEIVPSIHVVMLEEQKFATDCNKSDDMYVGECHGWKGVWKNDLRKGGR